MPQALEILKKYWKHDKFRSLQKEIIDSVLSGQDTFALLPTGGGKSICFQIPAMMKEGICLVISPLIALINDQVQNLQNLDIKTIALTGGLKSDEISVLLDNCKFGNYKFIYLSPERLQTEWILERIKQLPISMIAIDEAHCVSQWGHDFRPSYLKISNLKLHFSKIPFIALTASATKRVQDDVILQLGLKNTAIFKKSFKRDNIAYYVIEAEDKLFMLEQILNKNPEPSIIYVRNRKSCLDISSQLQSLGFRSTYYHGGLSVKEKEKNMQIWMSEEAQVIVATNAFGMGIDKANVKTVIHIQLPENLENYYQEAGRAGRNEERAYAILLTSTYDKLNAENQFISVLPDKDFLNNMFIKLCNYFQIAYGEGIENRFTFNLNQFCNKYQFPIIKTYNALQFLDRQGIVTLSQEFSEKVTVQFIISSKEVIRYISLNKREEPIILALLRTYPGIHEVPASINLNFIAKKAETTEDIVNSLLLQLKDKGIIDYQAKSNDTSIIFNVIREDNRTINSVSKYLEIQNNLKRNQLNSVIEYTFENSNCKSKFILNYFEEKIIDDCGICSYCISKGKKTNESEDLRDQILLILKEKGAQNSREIQYSINKSSDEIIFALQNLLESGKIILTSNNRYTLK
ncbi:MAG: RecQ family ATP-dependent DNA helicase [Flavobacteriaceae bacterium]|nr:RecQ family ATP-dependent DNA helicase [Flavobacteriaceae bacterium]